MIRSSQAYLFEYKWVLCENGTDPIIRHNFGLEFSSHCVTRQSEHVDFDISSDMTIRQELSGQDLNRHRSWHDPVNRSVCERVKHSIISTHESWFAKEPTFAVVLKYPKV